MFWAADLWLKKPFIFSLKNAVQEAKTFIFDGFKIDNERRES